MSPWSRRARLLLEELEPRWTPSNFNITFNEKFETTAVAGQSSPFNTLANFQGVTSTAGFTAKIHWGDTSTDSPADGQAVTITQDPRSPFLFDINGTHTYPAGVSFTYQAWVQLASPDGTQTWGGPQGPLTYMAVNAPPGSVTTPTIAVDKVFTTNSTDLTVDYTIQGGDSQQALVVDVYRSSSATYDGSDPGTQIHVADVQLSASDATVGMHEAVLSASQFQESRALRADPKHPYVIVTIDNQGTVNAADQGNTPQQEFRIWLVGAVVHGYTPAPPLKFGAQTWVDQVARILDRQWQFDDAFGFHWEKLSRKAAPGTTQSAAAELAKMFVAHVEDLGIGANDVVDGLFIGHSRGVIVSGQALRDLQGSALPQLKAGYMALTSLDAHPANNSFGIDLSARGNPLGKFAAFETRKFQAVVHDPQVVVPANVRELVVWYQHTPVTKLKGTEALINLWGEGAGQFDTEGADFDVYSVKNLTGPRVGHTEVHVNYQKWLSSHSPYEPL